MLRLSTIGPVAIEAGGKRVPPAKQQAFSALFYLITERGKPVPRRTLVELFFPEAPREAATHSVRQLLYGLKGWVPNIDRHGPTITIPDDAITWDVDDLLARGWATTGELNALSRGYLPDFAPRHSNRYTEWLEEHRSTVAQRLRTVLVAQIQSERGQRRYRALEGVARACLALDPLNEEATLAAAESLAMSGSKIEAVALLDKYLADVGSHSHDLAIPPRVLRERISKYVVDPDFGEAMPLIGRDQELSTILSLIDQSKGGAARACVVVGPSGIGKTRLVNEACSLAALAGRAVVRLKLHQHDARRPFAILRDLAPALLDLRGAIGASPDSLAVVRGLCGRGPSQFQAVPTGMFETQAVVAEVHARVIELVDAITAEQPVVVSIEDAHWIDAASLDLISEMLDGQRSITVILPTQKALEPPRSVAARLATTTIALNPLAAAQSATLLDTLFSRTHHALDAEFTAAATRLSGGVPFYLHLLFRQFIRTGDFSTLPTALSDSIVARLDRLEEPTRSVFDAIVVLGANSTEARLEAITQLPRYSLIQALRFLDEGGLIRLSHNVVTAEHDLFESAGRKRMPAVVARVLHRSAAALLEAEDSGVVEPLAIAAHWEACDEDRRALAVLTRSANEYLRLGRPSEATALLIRARQLAFEESDKAHIGQTLFESYRASGEYLQALEVARELGFFDLDAPWDKRLDGIVSLHLAGRPFADQRDVLAQIARNKGLSNAVRGRALRYLLIVAEDQNDEILARESIDATADLDPSGYEAIFGRVIFETEFGNPSEAIQCAIRLHQVALANPVTLTRLQGLCGAALALWRNGDPRAALSAAEDAYAAAAAAGVWSACTAYASLAADLHWHAGRKADARSWLAIAEESLSKSGSADGGLHLSGMSIVFALEDNDPDKAVRLLLAAEANYPIILNSRLNFERLAYLIRIDLARGLEPNRNQLSQLIEGHRARLNRGFQDYIADTIIAALKATGDPARATQLRNEYLCQRSDRCPPPPSLVHLGH